MFAVPIAFESAAGGLFGWYHAPSAPSRRVGVVICAAIGYEGIASYATYSRLAERLSATGFPVIRFDYHGTGDSTGDDLMPGRVAAWLESIEAAARELKAQSGVEEIVLVGVRFGANLAAYLSAEKALASAVVLFAPCASGRGYARELRAFGLLKGDARETSASTSEPFIEAYGFAFTDETLSAMAGIDFGKLKSAPARQTLLLLRDDMPLDTRLVEQLEALGTTTTVSPVPGVAEMMRASHASVVPTVAIEAIEAWLDQNFPARLETSAASSPPLKAPILSADGFVESGMYFGPGHRLFGVLTVPGSDLPVRDTAVLMLNVGTNHRVGPNRMYVMMARAWARHGFSVLRFDLAGMGDSAVVDAYTKSRLYSKDAAADVIDAMDHLRKTRGVRRFVLTGLCSGAYVAFQTALVDPRVAGLMLVNPRRFYWREGDTLDEAMKETYKSTRAYRRLLFSAESWKRLARGELDVQGVGARLATLVRARLTVLLSTLLGNGDAHEENLASTMTKLCRRGVDVFLVFAAEDDGLDYIEVHLGKQASRLRNVRNFRLELVENTDHTFTNTRSRERLTELAARHLAVAFS